jgi:rhodanese-related sulfurtransferase
MPSRGLGFALPAVLALACTAHSAKEPFQPVTVEQVQRMLGEKDVVIVDANVPEIFAEHHLPGARHVGPLKLAALLPADKDTRLVFYCTGPR